MDSSTTSCGAAAIKAKLIDDNPFEGMSVTVNGSTDKERFITEAESRKILKACPDLQWRLIFSLCRYGGFRCPSEVLALTWENVMWDSSRIIVTSPKTKRYKGHESRVIPMFPELASVLDEAYELEFDRLTEENPDSVAVVNGPVVTRYRDASQNLRTTFEKIVKRAGLTMWQKPFQNLRSTRETELMEIYPSHVVVSWIGHSEKVARKHCLQTTDAHFELAVTPKPAELVAISEPEETDSNNETVAHQVAHNTPATSKTNKPTKAKNPAKTNVLRGSADSFASLRVLELPRRDSKGDDSTNQNTGISEQPKTSGPTSGPISEMGDSVAPLWNEALDFLQAAWQRLRTIENIADDPKEAKQAGKAREAVGKILNTLEGGSR